MDNLTAWWQQALLSPWFWPVVWSLTVLTGGLLVWRFGRWLRLGWRRQRLQSRVGSMLPRPVIRAALSRSFFLPGTFESETTPNLLQRLQRWIKESLVPHSVVVLLGPTGSGRTSLLLRLLLKRGGLRRVYVPFSHPELADWLQQVPQPEKTCLLLDSLDEDPASLAGQRDRLDEILPHTQAFARVIIACAPGFFPENASQSGQGERIHYTGHAHYQVFGQVHLLGWDDRQVQRFWRQKFGHWGRKQRKLARVWLSTHPQARYPLPLLRSGDLLDQGRLPVYSHEWIGSLWQGRLGRGPLPPAELEAFYTAVARRMYEQRLAHQGWWLPAAQVARLAEAHALPLDRIDRQLLSRDSRGRHHFSHISLLAYRLAWQAFEQEEELPGNLTGLPLAAQYFRELLWDQLCQGLPDPAAGGLRLEGEIQRLTLPEVRPGDLPRITRLYLPALPADLRLLAQLPALKGLYLTEAAVQSSRWQDLLPVGDTQVYVKQAGAWQVYRQVEQEAQLQQDTRSWTVPVRVWEVLDLQAELPADRPIEVTGEGHKNRAALRVFSHDLRQLPDEYCTLRTQGVNLAGDWYQLYDWRLPYGEHDIFYQGEVFCFENGTHNLRLRNTHRPTLLIKTLAHLTNQLVAMLGEDDRHLARFEADDEAQVNDGHWLGRSWTWQNTDTYAYPLRLSMEKPERVELLICGLPTQGQPVGEPREEMQEKQ
jgi:hypothetical protein